MLKLLLQAIASNLKVQSQVNHKELMCNVCAGLKDTSKYSQYCHLVYYSECLYVVFTYYCP